MIREQELAQPLHMRLSRSWEGVLEVALVLKEEKVTRRFCPRQNLENDRNHKQHGDDGRTLG